ncbi:MAG: CHAT domain-containing tetratricopeptide repeat protein [Caldimonas sp.]
MPDAPDEPAAVATDDLRAAAHLEASEAALDPHRDVGDRVRGELLVLAGWRKTSDVAQQARSLARLAALCMAADRLEDAEGTAYEQLALAIRNRLAGQRTFALGQLGEIAMRRGRHALALRLLNYQYDLAREPGGGTDLEVEALDRLATAYLRLGRIDLAERGLVRLNALPEGANATPALRARRLDNIGLISLARGNADRAETCFRAALDGLDENDDCAEALDVRVHLARLLRQRGDRERSIDQLVHVLQHGGYHPLGQAQAQLLLGQQSRNEGELGAALKFFGRAAEIAARLGDSPLLAEALTGQGETSLAAGDNAAAETAARQAIAAVEAQGLRLDDASGVVLFAHQEAPFHLLERVQLARGAADAALEATERGRTRALLQLLVARQAAGRRVRDNKAIAATTAFDVMMDRGGQVEGVSFVTADQLRRAVEVLALPKVEPEPRPAPTVAAMQATAAEHGASLLVYSLLGGDTDEIAIWLVQAGAVHHRMAPPRESGDLKLVEEVAALVADLADASAPEERLDALLGRLHRRLVAPVAGLLTPDELLCIVPDGALFRVPFAALRDARGAPLVASHPLCYVPSVEVLALSREAARLQQGRGPAGPPLIVGAPSPVRLPAGFVVAQPLAELGYAAQEARDIASMLGADPPLLAGEATLAAVNERLPTASLAHFAAHALLDDVRPQASAILLAASVGSGADATLTVSALQDLSLRASLVVLSACGTALGPISGDGIAGFARALLTAGVPSAVVALWPLADASTWDLMTSFYGRLVSQGDGAAAALRAAMLEQREATPHPRDWAAMALYGQASTTL